VKVPCNSDLTIITVLLALGAMNYGWVFYPQLGTLWTALNIAAFVGIITTGILYRLFRAKINNQSTGR